jgi:hypothetical protein
MAQRATSYALLLIHIEASMCGFPWEFGVECHLVHVFFFSLELSR